MATLLAVVDRDVAHTHRLDRHLPIAVLGVIDREPPQGSGKPCRVLPTKVQLATLCSKGDAKLRQHVSRALEQPPEETADRTRSQALQPEADDAIVGHSPEGHILQAEGCQQAQAHASLAAGPGTNAHAG